jgi:hypothetical protein
VCPLQNHIKIYYITMLHCEFGRGECQFH